LATFDLKGDHNLSSNYTFEVFFKNDMYEHFRAGNMKGTVGDAIVIAYRSIQTFKNISDTHFKIIVRKRMCKGCTQCGKTRDTSVMRGDIVATVIFQYPDRELEELQKIFVGDITYVEEKGTEDQCDNSEAGAC